MARELQELRHDIKADAERKLAAVDLLLKHLDQGDDGESQESLLSHLVSGVSQSSPAPRAYGGGESSSLNGGPGTINVAQEVREAIDQIKGSFKQQDISHIITMKYPNVEIRGATVSNTIGRLMKRGYIRRVRKSHGSLPSIYRKSEAWPPPMINEADQEEEVVEEHSE